MKYNLEMQNLLCKILDNIVEKSHQDCRTKNGTFAYYLQRNYDAIQKSVYDILTSKDTKCEIKNKYASQLINLICAVTYFKVKKDENFESELFCNAKYFLDLIDAEITNVENSIRRNCPKIPRP